MNTLKTLVKHFLIVVLPLAISGATAYADSAGFRKYLDAHPALAVYIPVLAGALKAAHAVLPASPLKVSVTKSDGSPLFGPGDPEGLVSLPVAPPPPEPAAPIAPVETKVIPPPVVAVPPPPPPEPDATA